MTCDRDMKLMEKMKMEENIACLEEIIRWIDDPKPYALKVAKELRKQSIGNKVVMDDAAECLVDDCRVFKDIVKKLRNVVRRMKKDCRRTLAADPLIAPIWEVPICLL